LHLTDTISLDWLKELQVIPKPLPPGYIWKVIFDPTRTGDEPGLFYGAYFRFIDLVHGKSEPCCWPDGIVFENADTGDFLEIQNGTIQYPDRLKTLEEIKTPEVRTTPKRDVILITLSAISIRDTVEVT